MLQNTPPLVPPPPPLPPRVQPPRPSASPGTVQGVPPAVPPAGPRGRKRCRGSAPTRRVGVGTRSPSSLHRHVGAAGAHRASQALLQIRLRFWGQVGCFPAPAGWRGDAGFLTEEKPQRLFRAASGFAPRCALGCLPLPMGCSQGLPGPPGWSRAERCWGRAGSCRGPLPTPVPPPVTPVLSQKSPKPARPRARGERRVARMAKVLAPGGFLVIKPGKSSRALL